MLFNVVNEKDPRIRITILHPSGIAAMTGSAAPPKQQTVSLHRRIRLPCATKRPEHLQQSARLLDQLVGNCERGKRDS